MVGGRIFFVLAAAAATLGCCGFALPAAGEPPAESPIKTRLLIREEATQLLLADSEFAFHLSVDSPYDKGTVSWRHALDDRTLAAGELEISKERPATLKLQVPPLKPGVSVVTVLELTLSMETGNEPPSAIAISKTMEILDPDPFTGRGRWVESLDLSLFDPVGKTAEVLEALNVRPKRIASVGGLDAIERGILLIGEGIELDRSAGVAEAMSRLVRRGVSVVCLAPKSGDLPFPLDGETTPRTTCFADAQCVPVLSVLDKQISAFPLLADEMAAKEATSKGDTAEDRVSVSRFAPVALRGEVRLAVSQGGAGWPWVAVNGCERSSLVLCGFPLVATWQRDATARYFLAGILEMLQPDKETVAP